MREKLVLFVLLTGLMFTFAACNDPLSGASGDGDATDVTWSWGNPGTNGAISESSDQWRGASWELSGATITGTLGDVSSYGEVVIDAYLYASKNEFDAYAAARQADGDEAVPDTIENGSNKAFFKLLPNSDWNSTSVIGQQNNMNTNGETSNAITLTGIPTHVLVQVNKGDGVDDPDSGIGYIEVRSVTLKLRTDLPKFMDTWNRSGGSYLIVEGNKLTFNNATRENSYTRYEFLDSDLVNGKLKSNHNVVITYTLESYNPATDSAKQYQLVIQPANGSYDVTSAYLNGAGAQYPFVYDGKATNGAFDNFDGSGTITLDGDVLQAATATNNYDSQYSSQATTGADLPYPLTSIRILNNGIDDSDPPTLPKETTYTIRIDSINVVPK